jgi:hypothetical protein
MQCQIASSDVDFSYLSEQDRKIIETRTLKCGICQDKIKGNRINNLISHFFYSHGNAKPRGYGIDNIDEFVRCDKCLRWVAEICMPGHLNSCTAILKPPAVRSKESTEPVVLKSTFKRITPTPTEIKYLK